VSAASTTAGDGVLFGPGLTDVRMMAVAHTSFRRELKLAVPAVRRAPAGDHRRANRVADHVELFTGLVAHHHEIEDELLWDRLLERVPDEVAPLVHLMESQHETVHQLLDGCPALVAAWRDSASVADATRLADHLARLVAALCEHLAAEESRVLPLMARHVTASEWEEFTECGMESIPRSMVLTGFGMMLYEGDPEAIAPEIAKLPAPLRPVLPALGRWAFRRYARRMHGTPTPPRGTMTTPDP
jgi:hemerythrin-like domain-containing protein